jgi:DNA excision repair protein ERCC-3
MTTSGAAIVQSDKTVLIELAHPGAEDARHDISLFAELERAPEHIHTYRITRLAVWNAEAAGHTAEEMIGLLEAHSRFPLPDNVIGDITDWVARCGRIELVRPDGSSDITLRGDHAIMAEVTSHKKIAPHITHRVSDTEVTISPLSRGLIKQELLKIGWPANDTAGFVEGVPWPMALDTTSWSLRDYQLSAVDRFVAQSSGVVVLPCGAGKTVVGAGVMAAIGQYTLILVTTHQAARQWQRELVSRTTLTGDEVGVYQGSAEDITPVTIATYSMMTAKRAGEFRHLGVISETSWGLVIYDEVHLLPAPVFHLTANLQATRRLGLTATLVREDGREGDVFSLIGPKRFDAAWKDLEKGGYLAPAECVEVRVDLPSTDRLHYATLDDRARYRYAATHQVKDHVVSSLVDAHQGEQILVMGVYLDQLERVAGVLGAPLMSGDTPDATREKLLDDFRSGVLSTLVVSKVANFSIDLPEASVAIQMAGTFGSRQEEAQRLGRIVRPKADGRPATFYSVVTRDSADQDFAANRQRFLTEQGYRYRVGSASDLATLVQGSQKLHSENI